MRLLCTVWSISQSLVGGLIVLVALAGCGSEGNLTETVETVESRNISGVATPVPAPPPAVPPSVAGPEPAERVARNVFSSSNTSGALAFPSLNNEERAIFERALQFFITDRTPQDGLGPVFNQRICLGCHRNSDELGFPMTPLVTTSTPASRAARHGPTDHDAITPVNPPPTAAFTLFGDFSPAAGAFNPLAEFGGPIQHVRAVDPCLPDIIPPESIDPFLQGGTDPITGLSALGMRREVGERAAPPYIGRGLMEAIVASDIVANEDPEDRQGHNSSLISPRASNPECPGDCVSGRHNENSAAAAFTGGDPVIRVSRFGLRAAGPTLIQFMLGGTQGEIGLTSPFIPTEQNNNQNVGRQCDIAPDPEIKEQDILDLRTLIRLISLPDVDARLLEDPANPPSDPLAASIRRGAGLFGVDLTAFRSRMVRGMTPVGDDHAINQADRRLNCVGCHIPILRTGQSPAEVGAQHLSNKWFPIFSDLLLHNMGQIPRGLSNPVPPPPVSLQPNTFEISRNLADFALPGQGLATGTEWRTPPLMGIGRIGPPFLHDGRVFLSTAAGMTFVRTVNTSADGGTNAPLVIDDVIAALRAAIDLHDLPRPDAATIPPGGGCPVPPGGSAADVCPSLQSGNRSEARNVMIRWRALTEAEQDDVINFLLVL
jgi:CxxC motif-containing protein (DUF1111 family)